VNREDLNPITATKKDYRAWQQHSRSRRYLRLLRLPVVYLCILGVMWRMAVWMIIVPAVEANLLGKDRSLDGRLSELALIKPPVDPVSTSAAVVAQSVTAVFGWMLGRTMGGIPVSAVPGPVWRLIIWTWTGYMVLDPVLGVVWKLYERLTTHE